MAVNLRKYTAINNDHDKIVQNKKRIESTKFDHSILFII